MNAPSMEELSRDYLRVDKAIRFIEAHRLDQPSLDDIAEAVHLSPFHFQRLFKEWAGVSPKRFLSLLTYNHALQAMEEGGASVLDAALDAGLSGPSRLHDLSINFEAVTPGEAKRKGAGLTIHWGVHPSRFGPCVIGLSPRGICRLTFIDEGRDDEAVERILDRWPAADLIKAPEKTAPVARHIFDGAPLAGPLKLHLSGTNFQIQTWKAILALPMGQLASYTQVADAIGHHGAARAVGNAMRDNAVAFLIPCHRVVPKIRGCVFAPYNTGGCRRAAMLGWEAAQVYGEEEVV